MRKKRTVPFLMIIGILVYAAAAASASAAAQELTLYARSAVLMDGDSGRILYGKEAEQPMPMASTTKIMTCILALEQAEEPMVCTVSANAASQPQVKLGMRTGDSFYLRDLLYSLMLESHNDTAVCIAENVAGSVEEFAVRMNQKAEEIGCTDTHYVTPNGLDREDTGGEHHTTAADLACILRYCITQSPKAKEFLTVTQASQYCFSDVSGKRCYSCVNHNAFLTMMDGALTGKTGFTSKAGYCYVGALRRGERLYIVSLLACGWPHNKSYKWTDTRRLMEYGLANFEKRRLTGLSRQTPPVAVENGQKEQAATAVHQEELELLMRREETLTTELAMEESLPAPVKKGQQAGRLICSLNGEPFRIYPVQTSENVEEIDFGFCLRQIAEKFLI